MSKVNKSAQRMNKQEEIGRKSHFQSKGRISDLEKKYLFLEAKITELQGETADIDELKEQMGNLKRGLQNLWRDFKDSKNREAS